MRWLVLVAVAATNARAGTLDDPPPLPKAAVDTVSPALALGLSAGVTAAGIGVMAAGEPIPGFIVVAVGPTVGHLYARKPVSWALAVRAIGLVAFAVGAFDRDWSSGTEKSVAESLFIGGGCVAGAASIVEIATAYTAATQYNREQRSTGPSLSVVRIGPGATPGLALGGTF